MAPHVERLQIISDPLLLLNGKAGSNRCHVLRLKSNCIISEFYIRK